MFDGARECGRWVFVYAVRKGRCIVAEATAAEVAAMMELTTPSQMIEYLGIFETEG